MSRHQFNPCDWCNPDRAYREPIDFFDLFVNLFGKPIEPPANVVYTEDSLEDAVENKTVIEVMQALGYFNKYHKKDKVMIDKVYDQLVYRRELWYARSNPKPKNQRTIKVATHTPWRYLHDVLRRKEFQDDKFVLVSAQKARYFICIEYVLDGQKKIEELGICDEHYQYQRCDCNFSKVKVLCSRCNSYVEKRQCGNVPEHSFPWEFIRCFRLDHGRFLSVGDTEYIDTEINVNIKESVDPFDRFEKKRKSSHKKKSPKVSPVQELPPSYQEYEEKRRSPEIRHENPIQEPFIPDSLKNPYSPDDEYRKPEIIGSRGTPPIIVLKPPARVIPVKTQEPSFDEPPQANLPDESHQRHVEGNYSPIPRLPTPENDENQEIELPPRSPYDFPPAPLRERPGNLPYVPLQYQPEKRQSPTKIVEIPVQRDVPKSPKLRDSQIYDPIPPYDDHREPPRHERPSHYDPVPDSPVRFRPSPPILPPREPADFNVVVLGPTGVGKSTWINALANYLRYNTLADAKNNHLFDVIPVKFRIQDAEWNEYSISYGKPSENEHHVPGQSSTQHPQQYVFNVGKNNVRIIDTPGVTDTRGISQDEYNCQLILEKIRKLRPPLIHAIGIILKSNESRLGAGLEQVIVSLLSLFPKSAIGNIVFFFTYARGTMFRVGDTYNALTRLFDQIEQRHGTRLTLSPGGVYCVDNEAYRYLVVCAQKDDKLERCMLRFQEYEDSWQKSQDESKRFLNHLQNITPIGTSEVISYNSIKAVAEELAKLILADEYGADAYKLAYEIVIDYLIQNSIIVTDPLMRESIRSKRPAPINLGEKYFVDHRQHRSEVTKEEVYRYLKEFRTVESINIEFKRSIESYLEVYETYLDVKNVRISEDVYAGNYRESYNELDLAYGPGETTYSCFEEKRTVITEKVHYFDSRPSSFIGGQSIHSVV